MKSFLRFLKATIAGGILFLLPLTIVVVLLGKLLQVMVKLVGPIKSLVPVERIGGVALIEVAAVFAILALCFLCGILARSALGVKLFSGFDGALSLFPPYALIREQARTLLAGREAQGTLTPVLVAFDDYSQIAFEVKRMKDGTVVIFLPGAPDPWAGSLVLVDPGRVTPLDLSSHSVVSACKKLGQGMGEVHLRVEKGPPGSS